MQQSPLTRQVSNTNLEMSEYLDKIEKVQAEIRKLMGSDGIGDREKTVTENQKKRKELIKGIE